VHGFLNHRRDEFQSGLEDRRKRLEVLHEVKSRAGSLMASSSTPTVSCTILPPSATIRAIF